MWFFFSYNTFHFSGYFKVKYAMLNLSPKLPYFTCLDIPSSLKYYMGEK